jgi:hypothetical protein
MANKPAKGSTRLRGKIMEMVKQRQKTVKAASLEPGISYRQAKRVYQRYLELRAISRSEARSKGNCGPSVRLYPPPRTGERVLGFNTKFL